MNCAKSYEGNIIRENGLSQIDRYVGVPFIPEWDELGLDLNPSYIILYRLLDLLEPQFPCQQKEDYLCLAFSVRPYMFGGHRRFLANLEGCSPKKGSRVVETGCGSQAGAQLVVDEC